MDFLKISLCLLILLANQAFAEQNKALSQRYIPRLKQKVTFFGLGTVELGRDWGVDVVKSTHPTAAQAKHILQKALEVGINVIDTASSYQLSEERIGKYIPATDHNYLLITKPGEHSITARDPRCKVVTKDKVYCRTPGAAYDFSYNAIIADVAESLTKLQVNQLNVVLLHLDNATALKVLQDGEALKALSDLKQQGKVQFIGVSVNGPAALYAVKNLDIDVIELEYNLLKQSNAEAIYLAHKKGLGVIVRGGLATGLLTAAVADHLQDDAMPFHQAVQALSKLVNYDYDKLTALALAFLYQNRSISSVILGIDQIEYFNKDIRLLNQFKDKQLLREAKTILKKIPEPEEFTEVMGEYYNSKK